jgi:hypothetical protein
MSRNPVSVRIDNPPSDSPFRLGTQGLELEPGVSSGLPITFAPERPGTYEARLTLAFEGVTEEEIVLTLQGVGVPSPFDLGVPIPARPDQEQRRYRDEELARALDEARTAALVDEGAPLPEGGPDAPGAPGGGEEQDGTAPDRHPAASPAGGRQPALAVLMAAFGVTQDQAEDINNVPVPMPEGDTKPDLPPAESPGSEPSDPSGATDPEEDQGPGGDETVPDSEVDSSARKVPTFTLAPNSRILVFSSSESIDLQTFPIRLSAGESAFEVHGRIRFPDLSMAFGQTVGVKQFDNLVGAVQPDGSVNAQITLRLDDPGGAVLDLPMQLTTGMAVGYSAEGRLMFANGIPRDPGTGDLKLVGIVNIPLGKGSSLDKAPVYLEILGRLTF